MVSDAFRMILLLLFNVGAVFSQYVRWVPLIERAIEAFRNLNFNEPVTSIESENLMSGQQAETDSEGRFLLPELSPEFYHLIARRNNFRTNQRTALQDGRNNLEIIKDKTDL